MFKFGKKKRYTIGEKLTYFNSLIKNPNTSYKKKQWAKKRKKHLNTLKNNIKLGDVFIVDDKLMGNPRHKPRVVVVGKVKGDKVCILSARKSNKIMTLQNFDNQRILNMNQYKEISKYRLFEKRGFPITNNGYLTPKEKVLLQKKSNSYIR